MSQEVNQELRKKLRSDYQQKFNKKPYNGWSVEQLEEKLGIEKNEEEILPPKQVKAKEKDVKEEKNEEEITPLDAALERLRFKLKDGDARAAVLSLKGSTLPKDQLIQTLASDPRVRRAGGGEVAKIISELSKL